MAGRLEGWIVAKTPRPNRVEAGRFVDIERRLSSVLSEFARTLATDFPIQAILDHLVVDVRSRSRAVDRVTLNNDLAEAVAP